MFKDKAVFKVGWFLAVRDIKHSNFWTTALIVFVMSLTFLNMILIGGILLGLAQGMVNSFQQYYSGDLFITPATHKIEIETSSQVEAAINSLPSLVGYTKRETATAQLEYRYEYKTDVKDITESTGGLLVGIDPLKENQITNMASQIIAGTYLTSSSGDEILVGKNLFEQYSNRPDNSTEKKLQTATVGSRIKLKVNNREKEVVIIGIVGTGNNTIDSRIFINKIIARELTNNQTVNATEIAVKLKPGADPKQAQAYLVSNLSRPNDVYIQTAAEAVPGSSADITKTFKLLGNLVGLIALIVGSITIFIVIFVNAITRRKYIGILKGIGIANEAIEISYIFQALFYAFSGVILGSWFILAWLKPYLDIHPLVLPIAEGRLAITNQDLIIRAIILIAAGLISGFIPSRLVTKQNTLDSILGR